MGWQNWFSLRKKRYDAQDHDHEELVPRLSIGRNRDRLCRWGDRLTRRSRGYRASRWLR
mgnify:CR=1 FL=1